MAKDDLVEVAAVGTRFERRSLGPISRATAESGSHADSSASTPSAIPDREKQAATYHREIVDKRNAGLAVTKGSHEPATRPSDLGGEGMEPQRAPRTPTHKHPSPGGPVTPVTGVTSGVPGREEAWSLSLGRGESARSRLPCEPDGGHRVPVNPSEVQAHRTLLLGGVPAVARALTRTQGQYLAYIHYYTLVHRRPPSENEIADFFSVRGPSAHRMILQLEGRGYLSRTPGQPRTLKVLLSRESIPELE